MRGFRPDLGWLAASIAIFSVLLFRHLSYPLLWQDEAETAVFAERILEYGFPKVHGPRNVVYEFGTHAALGIDERTDAYIGTTWGHFYFAVPGVLWARGSDDLYAKTFRIRFPFAITGAVGVVLFALACVPLFGGDRARSFRFVACVVLLCAGSVSLLLHLREARYYSLLVCLMGAISWIHLRHVVFERSSVRAYGIALTLCMVVLFHVFFAAFFAMGLLLGLDALWRELVNGRDGPAPLRRVSRALAPLALALLLVAPAIAYYETFQIAAAFSEHLGLSLGSFLQNLRNLAQHLVLHELLIAVVASRLAVFTIDRLWVAPLSREEEQARQIALRMTIFCAGYALIGCLNPLVYERYFILLSPALSVTFVLDAFCVTSRFGAREPAPSRGVQNALIVTIALVALLTPAGRRADLGGRLQEISTPYRGPLDYAIPWILEHYPQPERLVIATNYENHPYMYYLGSHVIVGLSRSNIRRDRMLVPDLVVPRRRWRSSLPDAIAFLGKAEYESTAFEVRDLYYNNVPAVSASPSTPDPHRFQTALAETDGQRLVIHSRRAGLR